MNNRISININENLEDNAHKLAFAHAALAVFFLTMLILVHYFFNYLAINDKVTTEAFLHNLKYVEIAHVLDIIAKCLMSIHALLSLGCWFKIDIARKTSIVLSIFYIFAFPLTLVAFGFLRFSKWQIEPKTTE